jgi:menaquinone-dependent protoporphyrinogen oxidase
MRVLVAWGSKRGGTEGIARAIGDVLRERDYAVTLADAADAPSPDMFDAVILGGALYANRWHRAARRYATRHAKGLRCIPVWLFSSGPLDASAGAKPIEPTRQVAAIMERIGACGHVTFGGRLAPDARGFPASAMAKKHAGDWRNFERVRGWAREVARMLPVARPLPASDPIAGSAARLLAYAAEAAAFSTVALIALLLTLSSRSAVATSAAITPFVFGAVAGQYFRPRGARNPLPTAACFAVAAAIPLLIAHGMAVMHGFIAFWLPVALAFIATWAVGAIRSTMPWPKPPKLQEQT